MGMHADDAVGECIDSYWSHEDGEPVEFPCIICYCCDTGGLHWGKLDGKWRLFNHMGNVHVCPVNPLSELR